MRANTKRSAANTKIKSETKLPDPLTSLRSAKPARQVRSREARARLLKAGVKIFASKGYENAHIEEIAAAAGCSVGSFYRRFTDKEGFFQDLYRQFLERRHSKAQQFFEDPDHKSRTTFEVIELWVQGTAKVIAAQEGFLRALFERGLKNQDLFHEIRTFDMHQGRIMTDFLRARGYERPGIEAHVTLGLMMIQRTLMLQMLTRPTASGVQEPSQISQLTDVLAKHLDIRPGE